MRKFILFSLFAVLLTGCGVSPVKFKPENKADLNTIALIQLETPLTQMINSGSGMATLGAVGGAVIGSEASRLSGKLDAVLKKNNFAIDKALTNQLVSQLKQAGYSVQLIKIRRPNEGELLESYQSIKYNKADAIMDVVIKFSGYQTEHYMFSPHWRPSLKVEVALARPGSEKPMYSETIMYGYHNIFATATDLDSPSKYNFDEVEDVFAAGDRSIIAGLEDAAKSVARQIAEQLKK